MRLRNKILSYTLPLILIPFLLTALAVYYFLIRADQIKIREERSQSLNEAIVSFGKDIDSARKDINLLSNVPALANYLEHESTRNKLSLKDQTSPEYQARTVMELFFKQNPYYLQLSLVDENGLERIKFTKLPNEKDLKSLKNKEYFRHTLIKGSVQMPVEEIRPDKYATVFTNSIGNEEFLGMIVLVLNTEVFERAMRPLLQRNLSTFLFDDRGIVLASAFNSSREKEMLGRLDLAIEVERLLADPSFETVSKEIETSDGKHLLFLLPSESFLRVGLFQKQAGENWFMGVFEPAWVTSLPVGFQVFFFSILVMAVGAVIWATARVSQRITIPLESVTMATRLIARGETDLRLDIRTDDEVKDLAEALNRMNVELQDYQRQLVQTAKLASMGEMTSEISHEIQNRISGISLWLQHLDAETDDSDPRQEYVDEMKQGLNAFLQMLGNLKEYYKTPELKLRRIDLNQVVNDTLPFVRARVDEKQIELGIRLQVDLPETFADSVQIQSVILNLLLNAIETVGVNGVIEVRTFAGEAGENIHATVIDNGPGIAEADIPRIFYPYFSTKPGGSGLGLAISSNIIAAHNGRIAVESDVASGTQFSVVLPIRG